MNGSSVGARHSVLTIRLSMNSMLTFLFIFYFCREAVVSIGAQIMRSDIANFFYVVAFLFLFVICCLYTRFRNLNATIVCYLLVTVAIGITLLLHPEYSSWFFYSETNKYYSISSRFLSPKGALWALAVVSLLSDPKKIIKCLKFTAFVLFAYYTLKFAQATIQGYWGVLDANLEPSQSTYNLDFGYNIIFPMAYFAGIALLEKRKLFWIPYVAGLFQVIVSGSRGAFIFAALLPAVFLPFAWKNLTEKQIQILKFVTVVILPLLILLFLNFQVFISGFAQFLMDRGFSSRTLLSIVNGTISEANGRDDIYAMSLELIKTGGPFGRGVYGDRTTIGQYFSWGYSHNIFLEMLVSFGYIGGGILILLLVICVIKCFTKWCTTNEDRICFVSFFVPSLKLLFSSSFWYLPQFWGLLAVFFILRRKYLRNSDA